MQSWWWLPKEGVLHVQHDDTGAWSNTDCIENTAEVIDFHKMTR